MDSSRSLLPNRQVTIDGELPNLNKSPLLETVTRGNCVIWCKIFANRHLALVLEIFRRRLADKLIKKS